jgi:Na+/proline symporter
MLLWLVAAYLAVSIAIGLFAALKVHNTRDYITTGRRLPLSFILSMVFATWFGAETILGNPGAFQKEGISALIADPLGAGVCLILFGLFFARPLYRMNLLTLGDFFRRRYSKNIEVALSICVIASYLGWAGAQIAALGLVFNLLSNGAISLKAGMMIGATVVLLYTLLGGLWSVAITTFVQMIIIVVGLLYVTWIANNMAGGFSVVIEHAAQANKFSLSTGTTSTGGVSVRDILLWGSAFFTMALGSIPQQDVFQRANAACNERIAIWGTTLGGLGYIIFSLVPIYLSYTALIIAPEMVASVDAQVLTSALVLSRMSIFTQVIFFGALLSVIMSTASGTLLAPSVTFSENVLRAFSPKMTDAQYLLASRMTVVVFAMIITFYAMSSSTSIRQMLEGAYCITLAGAFVPLVAGIFWKRANNLGGALAIGLGLGVWIVAEGLIRFGLIPDLIAAQFYGLAASAIGMVLGVRFGPQPTPEASAYQHKPAGAPEDAAEIMARIVASSWRGR